MSSSESAGTQSVFNRRDLIALLVFFAGALLFTASLWLSGPWFYSHELMHYLTRTSEMSEALRGGQMPVRWADNFYAGYGSPFFNFYGPLTFYVSSLPALLGIPVQISWKLLLTILCFAGSVGTYFLIRPHCRWEGALSAGVLYQFAPYHALDLYVRGNLAEYSALCVWPFAFWAIDAALRRGSVKNNPALPLAALAVGGLAVTHTITAYMASFNLVGWALLLTFVYAVDRDKPYARLRLVAICAVAGIAGLLLAAFYFVPVLHDLKFVHHDILYNKTQISDHFLYPLQLIIPNWGYGLSIPGPDDGMDFELGIALWLGVLAAIYVLIRTRFKNKLLLFSIVATFFFLLASLKITEPLWRFVPKSEFVQFSWRLLVPSTFWACIAAGIAVSYFSERLRQNSRLVLMLASVLLPVLLSLPYLRADHYYETPPVFTTDQRRVMMFDTTGNEYLPLDVERLPETYSLRKITWQAADGNVARLVEQASASYLFDVEASQAGLAQFDVFFFPGWTVTIDGEAVPVTPTEDGLISWQMPEGDSIVEIEFRETPVRRAANWVSAITLFGLLVWLLASWRGYVRQ